MTPKEIVSMILAYEDQVTDLWIIEMPDITREKKTKKLIKKQVGLIENFKKDYHKRNYYKRNYYKRKVLV